MAPPSGLVLAGSRPAAAVAFEAAVVDFFVDAADLLGVPKSVAAIYGLVFASPGPLSFADIESRLDFSKGSISQGLRMLREVGALKEVSGPDDRAELFTPDLEMRKLIQRFLEQRLQKQLDSGRSRLAEFKKAVTVFPASSQKELTLRLKKLQQWHDRARGLMPIARTFLKIS
ncbi:MAG TPA: transcriptional regulator [Lacunisphaera sp.]|nr:transcriptional regulator [Lacunisphaera sp.]